MAKSVKVDRLLKDLAEDLDNVVQVLTEDQIHLLSECKSECLKLAGLVCSTYQTTELSEAEAEALSEAEAKLAKLADRQSEAEDQVREDQWDILKTRMEKAEAKDRGPILLQSEVDQAEALDKVAEKFDHEKAELQDQIRKLANAKLLAAEKAVMDLYNYTGASSASSVRPPIPGNDWLVLDLYTRSEQYSPLRCQFYYDSACTVHIMPVGQDWHKNLARPFAIDPDVWTEVCTLPAEKLTSASLIQALSHEAIRTMRERKSVEDLAAHMSGVLINDNVDQTKTGGSRSVWQVVSEKQDPGYARQIYGEKLLPYKLPQSEAKDQPAEAEAE